MEWNIDDNPLQSVLVAAIKQGSFKQPGGLIMKQGLPPPTWNEFWENNGSELAVIMLLVGLFEIMQQGRDN